ncbi:MAG TPA: trehalose-phosphatase [Candidatus Acidoferrales bacterium]|jgi:trehalose 6-phosphate phosphatase|nr:trehalose-phosphatase [Candidatus Acidoferrales bacterium]
MLHTKKAVPHLFHCWNQVSDRIRAAEEIRLFLDFDGTLVHIYPTPEQVKLPAAVRRILSKLSSHPRMRVALVSGRRNSVLREFIRVPRIQLLGLYGWERKGGMVLPARTRKALPLLRAVIKSLPTKFPGIRIEQKGVSFAIHFRGAPHQAIRRAKIWTRRFMTHIRADFAVVRASSAWEIVPRQVKGKGVALRELLKGLRTPFLPIYLGDDLTDEPAFQVLRRGITIRVGPAAPTSAHFRLKDASEVRDFLERLQKTVP